MGRHGGINILHQKSWHVWRLDNRLTVERDELRHAEQEREKRKAQEQASFTAKVARLRRKALGQSEEQEALSGVGLHRPHDSVDGPGTSSGSRAAAPAEEKPEGKGKGKGKTAQSFKYGMVTTSNLKKAEQDLDERLRRGGNPKESAKSYWGDGDLGSGPHINLFEEAERELGQCREDHEKQVRYTQRNNELAEKSKRRPLSEFDEIANDVPWYMSKLSATGAAAAGAGGGDEDSPESPATPSKTKRKVRHGQVMLRIKSEPQQQQQEAKLEPIEDAAPAAALRDAAPHAAVAVVAKKEEDLTLDKKVKKEKKAKKEKKEKASREERRHKELMELEKLRQERRDREAKERARVCGLPAGARP